MKSKSKALNKARRNLIIYLMLFIHSFGHLFGQPNLDICLINGETEVCKSAVPYTYTLDYAATGNTETTWTAPGGNIVAQSSTTVQIIWVSPLNTEIEVEIFDVSTHELIAVCNLDISFIEVGFPFELQEGSILTCTNSALIIPIRDEPKEPATFFWEVFDVAATISNPNILYPEFVFLETGLAEVCLTITLEASGCAETFCQFINVADVPSPTFDVIGASNANGMYTACPNQDIIFQNTTNAAFSLEYYWEISSGNNASDVWTFYQEDPLLFSFPAAGNYTVTLVEKITGNEFCEKSTSINISVEALPPVEILCPSTVCEGEVAVYYVETACSEYNWSVSPQGQIISNNGNTIEVLWSMVTGYETAYVMFDGTSCTGFCTAPSIITIPVFPTEVEIFNARDGLKCFPGQETFSLPVFPGALYAWTFEILPQPASTGNVSQIRPNSTNIYRLSFGGFRGVVRVKAKVTHPISGCSFESTYDLEVMSLSISGPNQICIGEEVDLELVNQGNSPIVWQVVLGSNIIFEQEGGNNITIPGSVFYTLGNFRVTATVPALNGGSCIATKIIATKQSTNTMLSGPTEVCLGQEYIYKVDNDFYNYTFHWTVNGVAQAETGPCLAVIWNSPGGPFEVSVIAENPLAPFCLAAPATLAVNLIETPNLTIEGDPTPCPDSEGTYSVMPDGGLNYVWSINSSLGSIVSGSNSNEITVQWAFDELVNGNTATLTASALVCGQPVSANFLVTLTPFELDIMANDVCAQSPIHFMTNASTAQSYQWFIDGELVPAPYGSSAVFTLPFEEGGNYCISVQVKNPDGCSGTFSATDEITVYDNVAPYINPVAALPCPVGTPFTRLLQAIPNSQQYNYIWYFNGQPIPNQNGSSISVSQPGTYYVQVQNGSCSNISDPLMLNYLCGESCDCPPDPDFNFNLSINANPSPGCGFISFSGTINPFANAIAPRWEILKPDQSIEIISILNPNALIQSNYPAEVPGTYFIYLKAGYRCADSDEACQKTAAIQINIPFIPDFDVNFTCVSGANNTYTVVLTDNSLYFENATSVIRNWNNSGSSGTSYSIPGVVPATSLQLCLKLSSTLANGYNCQVCKTVVTPGNPSASFTADLSGLCEDQKIIFTPNFPEEEILELEWNFGDNSISKKYEAVKVYQNSGTYTVSLTLTTIYGCQVVIQENITVLQNNLNGLIQMSMMDCQATANLNYLSLSGNPTSYLWQPGGFTTSSINVMESNFYGLTVTDNNGCEFSPPAMLVELVDPFPTGIGNVLESCSGSQLNVTNVGSYSYVWTVTENATGNTFTGTGLFFNLVGFNAGTYTVSVAAFATGTNQTCASTSIQYEIFGLPDPIILDVTLSTCNPPSYIITSNYEETEWYAPPSLEGTIAQSVFASENGTYSAQYEDENGCQTTNSIIINDIIDFSYFLMGCYDYCSDDLESNTITLPGIPGNFLAWEWRFIAEGGNVQQVLASGTGPITPLTLNSNLSGSITLWVNNGDCQQESGEFHIMIYDCVPCDIQVRMDECRNGCTTLHVTTTATELVWSPSAGLDLTDPFNPVICGAATATNYTVAGFINGLPCGVASVNVPDCGCVPIPHTAELVFAACTDTPDGFVSAFDVVFPGFPVVPITSITVHPIPAYLYYDQQNILHYVGTTSANNICIDIYLDEDCPQTHCFGLPECPPHNCHCTAFIPETCFSDESTLLINAIAVFGNADGIPATTITCTNVENPNEVYESPVAPPLPGSTYQDVDLELFGTDINGDGLLKFNIKMISARGKVVCEYNIVLNLEYICDNLEDFYFINGINFGGGGRSANHSEQQDEVSVLHVEPFNIFPVPSNDKLFVSNPSGENVIVKIFDTNGKNVTKVIAQESSLITVPVIDLIPGVYLIQLLNEQNQVLYNKMVPIIH